VPVVAWAITGALKRKIMAISENAYAPKSVNDFAKGELLMFCASY
jgi:hypothetical protein